jgi:hypothetical protein
MKLNRRQHRKEHAEENEAKCVSDRVSECPSVGGAQRTNALNLSVHRLPQTGRRVVLLLSHPVVFLFLGTSETCV